jgi:uncharacterized protein (TIGR00288 family)
MNEKLKLAVFVDYDNIEIGVKSTLQREFEVATVLEALKERGDLVAKFAYADWGRQEGAKRQMAENAVQMVQRIPSPRGDKNGADINLALDALEMAFTHPHINAFAIVSGDSDFIPLVNKLKEYGKTIFVVGGRAFTSTILQKNCHEFISFEVLTEDRPERPRQERQQQQQQPAAQVPPQAQQQQTQQQPQQQGGGGGRRDRQRERRQPLDLTLAMPLVERALQVLHRREVTPQLGLLKSTMLQLDSAFSERAYGAGSFTDFIEKLRNAGYVNVSGEEGRYVIERKTEAKPAEPQRKPEEMLSPLRDLLEEHRIEMDEGRPAEELEGWVREANPDFEPRKYGFQEFAELLNFAQDKLVVRVEPTGDKGLMVFLGGEFYPPAPPEPTPEELAAQHVEADDEKQPETNVGPPLFNPEPPPKRKRAPRKAAGTTTRKRTAKTTATKKRAPARKRTPPQRG